MSSPTDQPESESSYPIDVENMAEAARLIKQAREATETLGLFPEKMDLTGRQTLLDVGCGPGEWSLNVAKLFPDRQIVGIDISQMMIQYAQHIAHSEKMHNVQFRVMDIRQPLDLPDKSFDMVHLRFLTGALKTSDWPPLLRECWRVLRPGGVICNSEGESLGITTSPSLARLNALQTEALRIAGHCFTPSGEFFGIIAVQERLLQAAGFQHIQRQAHIVNYSAGMPRHDGAYDDWRTVMKLTQPFLARLGLATPEELGVLYERMLAEMQAEDFCAVAVLQTVWGEKPAPPPSE